MLHWGSKECHIPPSYYPSIPLYTCFPIYKWTIHAHFSSHFPYILHISSQYRTTIPHTHPSSHSSYSTRSTCILISDPEEKKIPTLELLLVKLMFLLISRILMLFLLFRCYWEVRDWLELLGCWVVRVYLRFFCRLFSCLLWVNDSFIIFAIAI